MMATTLFLWMRVGSIHEKYKTAVLISGMVTFIAAYHYFRIFNSWVESYAYGAPGADGEAANPTLTGIPFNDAYRYMDWLLTVPLLLMEIVLVMKIPEHEISQKCLYLGVSSGLMIICGYPGELLTKQSELSGRWMYWGMSMIPFCYVVYTIPMFGASGAGAVVGIQVGYCMSMIPFCYL